MQPCHDSLPPPGSLAAQVDAEFHAHTSRRSLLLLPVSFLLPPCTRSCADSLAAQVDAEFHAHMSAVDGQTDAIIAGCFGLLPRLGEIESMVRHEFGMLPCKSGR